MTTAIKRVPITDGSSVRAKVLPRTVTHAVRAFDAACTQAGLSNADVARAWCVDERIVRDVRAGARPLALHRLDALPSALRATFARLLLDHAETEDGDGPSSLCVVRGAVAVGAATGSLERVVLDATADGVVDEREAREIVRGAGRVTAAATVLVRTVTAVGGRDR